MKLSKESDRVAPNQSPCQNLSGILRRKLSVGITGAIVNRRPKMDIETFFGQIRGKLIKLIE